MASIAKKGTSLWLTEAGAGPRLQRSTTNVPSGSQRKQNTMALKHGVTSDGKPHRGLTSLLNPKKVQVTKRTRNITSWLWLWLWLLWWLLLLSLLSLLSLLLLVVVVVGCSCFYLRTENRARKTHVFALGWGGWGGGGMSTFLVLRTL